MGNCTRHVPWQSCIWGCPALLASLQADVLAPKRERESPLLPRRELRTDPVTSRGICAYAPQPLPSPPVRCDAPVSCACHLAAMLGRRLGHQRCRAASRFVGSTRPCPLQSAVPQKVRSLDHEIEPPLRRRWRSVSCRGDVLTSPWCLQGLRSVGLARSLEAPKHPNGGAGPCAVSVMLWLRVRLLGRL